MSGTLQLVEPVEVLDTHAEPKLLVEWSSRWQEFLGSIGPALSRSQARLAGEAPFGLIPLRIMLPSYFLEAFLIFAAILVPAKIAQLRPYVAPRVTSHDVIYYTGDELPRVEDLGGAEAGTAGRAGGDETHHRTQTIKISRGGSLVPQVVDAPNLKLPASTDAVANLLAVRPDAGPPPAEGLRSSRSAPNLATSIVAPAPNVIRDYTRNGVQMESVIAPAPTMPRDRGLIAPTFNATLIPPAPDLPDSHKLVAPAMTPAVIPPAPRVSRDRTMAIPSLNASVVAPAPTVTADRARSGMALATNVIPPAPNVASRQMSHAPVQMTRENIVPPPVSAPERATSRTARLNMPAPQVVAPPPSADLASDTHRVSPGGVSDPSRSVVPPPPSQTGGSFMSSIIGKIFGASEVVPPPPSISSRQNNTAPGASLAGNVVPPPPSVGENSSGANPHGYRNGQGASLSTNVVAPPPSIGATGGTGTHARSAAPYLGSQSVVPPPPQLAGAGGGTGKVGGGAGAPGGTLLANNIVPPPPSVGGGNNSAGSGLGRRGAGLGAPNDVGANLAPPKNGGSGANAGAVISTQPGAKVGVPVTSSTGSLAMSPSGADSSGIGGSGGGSGIGHGNGPGSALSGSGTGTAKSGAGHGSDPAARGGISPNPGPGGAGSMTSGSPAVRGVEISGGSSVVTLPSFGDDPAANDPSSPSRTNVKQRSALDVTIVATASSGGAFEPYKKLLHGVQYTTYLDTSLGNVVMEFADESAPRSFGSGLTAPSPVRVDLPKGTAAGRMVVACIIDASGNLGNIKVLEPGSAQMTANVVAALRSWKFQPATLGDKPVQVTAILGFGINTDDRF